MNTAARQIRKGWAIYLAGYAVLFAIFLYPSLQFAGRVSLVQAISTLLDVVAMACLYRHVRRLTVPSLGLRLAFTGIALLFAARIAFVLYLLVPNVVPWQGSPEQWVSLWGVGGLLFQIPMALALLLYSVGSQGGEAGAAESLQSI